MSRSARALLIGAGVVAALVAAGAEAGAFARGVAVTLVEGLGRDDQGREAWFPDRAAPGLAGVRFVDASGAVPGSASGHATSVARVLLGQRPAWAPRIASVTAWSAADWLGPGYLQAGSGGGLPPLAVAERVANHSWVGDSPAARDVLRRVDWLVDRDEYIQVVGVNNEGSAPALLAGAYNVIAVGRTSGSVSGTAPVDYLYTRDRARPDLVAPAGTTSEATPFVAAAAAALVGVARDAPGLAADPRVRSTRTRAGVVVTNAGRAEVIRAVLMAGAARHTPAGEAPGIADYRAAPAQQTRNGLDRRYGAGQLDVVASHRILLGGEQDSAEDTGPASRAVHRSGFDYAPRFGGRDAANTVATYRLPPMSVPGELRATLVWHLAVESDDAGRFDGAATLVDLDLRAWDVTGPGPPRLLAASTSTIDNTESVWLTVPAGRRCQLEVGTGAGSPFARDYALAWDLSPVPVSGTR